MTRNELVIREELARAKYDLERFERAVREGDLDKAPKLAELMQDRLEKRVRDLEVELQGAT